MKFAQKLLTLLFLSISFISCIEQRDLKSNSLIVQISYTPDGLHPVNGNSSVKSYIHSYTQKSLMGIDLKTEKDIPILIKELPHPDESGLIYSFEIQDDIRWDDGEELNAEDIIFSTKITLCPLSNNADIRPVYSSVIDSIYRDKTNPKKLYMKAKTKHIQNKDIIGGIIIQQKKFWDPKGVLDQLYFKNIHDETFISKPSWDDWFNKFNHADNSYIPKKLVGLGPYQVTAFEKDNYITLERKKNWWGDKIQGQEYDNYPEKIIFKIIKDNSAVYLGIKNQEIDVTQNAGGISKLLRLQKTEYFNNNYKSEFVAGYNYNYMGMNMKPDGSSQKPFFTSKKVRRAIAHLVPIEEMIEVIYYGKAMRQASIVSPLKSSCDKSLKFIEYDISKAKKLLADEGWKDTDGNQIIDKVINGNKIQFSFKLNYVSGGSAKDIVFMMQESFRKVGIDLQPNPMDFNTLYQNASNHTFDAMLGGWSAGSGYDDPSQLWNTESWTTKGSNFCGFGNAKSDSLIILANTSLDSTTHKKAFKEFQRLIYDEQPYVFLWSAKMPMVIHKRFPNGEFYRARPNVSLGSLKME